MSLSQGKSDPKLDMNCACFPKEKAPEFTKKGEIHEFLSFRPLFWFGLPERLLKVSSSLLGVLEKGFFADIFLINVSLGFSVQGVVSSGVMLLDCKPITGSLEG